jgi:hypothetical protein
VAVALLVASLALAASLLQNGDFERWSGWPRRLVGWRWFAVGGARGIVVKSDAAGSFTSGKGGVELRYTNPPLGDSALDDDADKVPVAARRVYKLTVDARLHAESASPVLAAQLVAFFPDASSGPESRSTAPLTTDFETYGTELATPPGSTAMLVRFDLKDSGGDTSAYLDNAHLEDVTSGADRLVNGDFENSASRLLGWRFFDLGGGHGRAALVSDAASGRHAALLEVSNLAGITDTALDVDPNKAATIGGEKLRLTFQAKKISGEETRLKVVVPEYWEDGSYHQVASTLVVDPGREGYRRFALDLLTDTRSRFLMPAFRVSDQAGNLAVGAYLVDDVSVTTR